MLTQMRLIALFAGDGRADRETLQRLPWSRLTVTTKPSTTAGVAVSTTSLGASGATVGAGVPLSRAASASTRRSRAAMRPSSLDGGEIACGSAVLANVAPSWKETKQATMRRTPYSILT